MRVRLLATGRLPAVRTAAVRARGTSSYVAPRSGAPVRATAARRRAVDSSSGGRRGDTPAENAVGLAVPNLIRPRCASAEGGGSHRQSRARKRSPCLNVATQT